MEIYKYLTNSSAGFTSFLRDKKDNVQKKVIRSGNSLKLNWEPIHLIPVKEDCHQGDFSLMLGGTGLLLFSCRAWSILEPFIGNDVEALPVFSNTGETLLAINLLSTVQVDCLDKENSKINYREDGSPASVRKYVFLKGMLQDKILFKVPETAHFETFVTEKFKALVEQENLTGLDLIRKG